MVKITPQMLAEIINIAAPPILAMVAAHHASTGTIPTLGELTAELNGNIDKYMAEGEAFKAAHPDTP